VVTLPLRGKSVVTTPVPYSSEYPPFYIPGIALVNWGRDQYAASN